MTNKEVIVSSGNILSKGITWKKGNESAEDELYYSLKFCIEQHKEVKDHSWENGNSFEFVMEEDKGNKDEVADRQDLKVTGKVFLYSLNPEDISRAIQRGLQSTSVEHLDTLVFAISKLSDDDSLSINTLKDVWSIFEEMVMKGKVKMIGLCDISTELFIQLYSWAKVKPNIIQINLASCCVVPPDLSEFCKQQNVQLLTHSDPINILSEDNKVSLIQSFQSVLPTEEEKGIRWDVSWVLRYQVHLKCRGVLSTKGYVASIVKSHV